MMQDAPHMLMRPPDEVEARDDEEQRKEGQRDMN
jgi:hypothetical protein